ncbi:isopenicillin N synthase family oxygenase [Patescibacteria group bacterium]|nr:isopenicillin N synthase family oxygenase [Patescibacteria group bacterium]
MERITETKTVLEHDAERSERARRMIEDLLVKRFVVLERAMSLELIERKLSVDRQLFSLPDLEAYRAENINDSGFRPEGKEYATAGRPPDKKRMWQTFRERDAFNVNGIEFPRNKWPSVDGFKERTLEVYGEYERIAFEVLSLLEMGLGLPDRALQSLAYDGNSMLRTNYYPPESELEPNAYGLGRNIAHTDVNLLTLMHAPTTGGFEIFTEERGWEAVETKPGDVVLITGKMLLVLTGGYLRPAWHRVVDGPGERFSLPFFLHPKPWDMIAPFQKFLANNESDLPPALTATEFLEGIREDKQGLRAWVKRHSDVPPERKNG